MKRMIFVVLGLTLCLMTWAQVAWGGRELTLNIPPGWTPVEPISPQQKLRALLVNEQGIAQAELILAVESVQASLTLEGYFQQVSQSLPSVFQSYTPQETTPVGLSNLSGLRHKFLFRVQGNPNELQGLAFFFLLDSQVYTLLFDCLSAQFPQLEPQFTQIVQGVTLVDSVSTATPSMSSPLTTPAVTPSQGLPSLGGAATPETEEPSYWIYQNPQGSFKIPLPQGTSLSEDLENGSVYATPNQGQLVILVLENENAVQGIVAQAIQGKNFHGTSQLNTTMGNPVQVALYTSKNPETGVEYATLVGTLPGKTLLILLVLPVAEYQNAAGWIEALLTRIEAQ